MGALDSTPFILSAGGSNQSDDPDMRKFIRRHVMLGKNRGKTFPQRRKPTRKTKSTPRESTEEESSSRDPVTFASKIPQQIGSDLSSIAWADSVDVSTMAVIMDFTHYTKKSLAPIEIFIEFPKKDIKWLEPLITDAVWVHMMAFMSYTMIDVLRGQSMRPADQRTSPHFARSLRLLRERLLSNDRALTTTNSTVQVILSLASHATMHGEFEEVKCHLMGLRRIVELRGGIDSFQPWPKLVIEILRIDIALSLHGGTAPVFFQDSSADTQWPYPLEGFPHVMDDEGYKSLHSPYCGFLDYLDHGLRLAWKVLRGFCLRINNAALTGSQQPRELLVDTMTSVMYRLLQMRFPPGCLSEVIRLGLLSFGSGIFLQWPGFPLGPTLLPAVLRESLSQFRQADDMPHLVLWVLIIGATNVFSEEDKIWLHPWLKATTDMCGISSWEDMNAILHTLLWIDAVHEDRGRAVFAEVYTTNRLGICLVPNPEVRVNTGTPTSSF